MGWNELLQLVVDTGRGLAAELAARCWVLMDTAEGLPTVACTVTHRFVDLCDEGTNLNQRNKN